MKKTLTLILVGAILGSTVAFAATKYFSDVPVGLWYSDEIASLSEKGIITGYSDGTFGPTKNVSRAELAVMLDRLIDYIETIQATKMDEATAVEMLEDAGCMWDTADDDVSVVFEDSNWVIKSSGCGGECRINAFTEEINSDDNPMCMGVSELSEAEAIEMLEDAGCFWDLSHEDVSIVHEGNDWVIQKSGCGGVCSISDTASTPAHIDESPMCMGLNP